MLDRSTHSLPVQRQTAQPSSWQDAVKATCDYLFAFIALLLLSPVLLAVAAIIRLDSPGPIIFRRRVMGQGGRQFDAFKFRTMLCSGNEILAAQPDLKSQLEREGKLKQDPRITRCGRWMRKFSLDELPQLVNVLRGEMSLIGPRMISPPELAHYSDSASILLSVKPGISGLWQVSGRSQLSYSDRVRLDIQYVRSRSIWLDARLLLRTIPAVLLGRGAY